MKEIWRQRKRAHPDWMRPNLLNKFRGFLLMKSPLNGRESGSIQEVLTHAMGYFRSYIVFYCHLLSPLYKITNHIFAFVTY